VNALAALNIQRILGFARGANTMMNARKWLPNAKQSRQTVL